MKISEGQALLKRISESIETVMRGKKDCVRYLVSAFASGGHVLMVDMPGTGKTTLAKAMARSLALEFGRIQFTPDLLPSDILGVSIFDQRDHQFHFHKGPLFCDILLADEINRASPRTQSALLEAMAENQVSLDRVNHILSSYFFVIATQNPVEFHGTYPLPEAQMDRFAMSFSLGYVDIEGEMAILDDQQMRHPLEDVKACADADGITAVRELVKTIKVSEELKRYMVRIVAETRSVSGVKLGASPRASLALYKTAQALALFDGLDFVTPEHVRELAVPVIAHRLVIDSQAQFSGVTGRKVIREILNKIEAPA